MQEQMMRGSRSRSRKDWKVDRISELPDSILNQILSFLNTSSAVRTCVLSKRWRLVWTSLPNLDFRYKNAAHGHTIACFSAFVNNVLALRDGDCKITRFRFSSDKDTDPSLVEGCMRYALRRHVEELNIRALCILRPVEMPLELATCQSLRVLKLTSAISSSIVLPQPLNLPGLKVLYLKNFKFSSDWCSTGDIFSGCPSLESLILCKCAIRPGDEKLKILDVKGPQLKKLEILYWRCLWAYFHDQAVVIAAPKLTWFKYQGQLSPLFFTEDLPSIDNVCIDLCCPTACASVIKNNREQRTAENLMNMLAKLSTVKSLSLSLRTLEIISSIPDIQEHGPSTFGNLRYLRLFTDEEKCSEITLPVGDMTQSLKSCVIGETFIIDLICKDPKLPTFGFGVGNQPKTKSVFKDTNSVLIPVNVLTYLIQSSPCAQTLTVEFPEESLEEDQ